jgi:hypothetical protein
MNFLMLGLALFLALLGILYAWRYLLWVFKKATFRSVPKAFSYAFAGSAFLAASAWTFSMAVTS